MGKKEGTILALFMLLAGLVLIYAGIQGKSPLEVLAFGGKNKTDTVADMPPNTAKHGSTLTPTRPL